MLRAMRLYIGGKGIPAYSTLKTYVYEDEYRNALLYPHTGLRHLGWLVMVRSVFTDFFGWSKDDYRILKTEAGKPFCDRKEGWAFSVSHSGDYVIAIFSDRGDVGADIEKHRGVRMPVARRYFSSHELEIIKNGGEDAEKYFYDFWTIREAYVKYRGGRLGEMMRRFYADKQGVAYRILTYEGESESLSVLPLYPDGNFIGSLYSGFVVCAGLQKIVEEDFVWDFV